MGWQNDITKTRKQIIQEAALTLLCYNRGYKKVVGTSQVEYWIKNIEQSVMRNEAGNVLAKNFKRKTSYMDMITDAYPTYFHEMRCQATQILSDAATFHEISIQMNLQTEALRERPTLQLDKFKLWRWFKKNKGKKHRKVKRLLLTDQHKETWLARAMLERLDDEEEINFYEDEKWA